MQDSTNLEALISKYSQRNRRFRLRVKPPRPPSDAQIYCSFCASPRVLSRELYFFCLTCEVYVCEECYCMKRHAGRSHDVYFMGVSPSGTAVEVKPSTATTTTTTTMTPNKNEKGNNAVANTPIIIATPTVDQQKRHEHFLTYNRSLRTSYPEDYNVDDSFFTLDPNCNYITCDECVNRMVAQASAKQQSPLHTRLAESSRGGFFIADYIRGPFFRCVTCAADVCEECFERGACTTHDKGEGRDQSRHHLLYMGNAPQPDEVVVNSEAELDRALEVVAASVSPTPPMRTPGPVKRGRSSASNAFPSTPRSAPRALLPPPPPPAAAAAATPTRESTQATPQKVPNGFVQLHLPPNNVSGDVIISRQELEIVHQTQHAADFSVQRVVVAPIAAAATSPVTFLIFVVTTENNTANCNNNNNNNNNNTNNNISLRQQTLHTFIVNEQAVATRNDTATLSLGVDRVVGLTVVAPVVMVDDGSKFMCHFVVARACAIQLFAHVIPVITSVPIIVGRRAHAEHTALLPSLRIVEGGVFAAPGPRHGAAPVVFVLLDSGKVFVYEVVDISMRPERCSWGTLTLCNNLNYHHHHHMNNNKKQQQHSGEEDAAMGLEPNNNLPSAVPSFGVHSTLPNVRKEIIPRLRWRYRVTTTLSSGSSGWILENPQQQQQQQQQEEYSDVVQWSTTGVTVAMFCPSASTALVFDLHAIANRNEVIICHESSFPPPRTNENDNQNGEEEEDVYPRMLGVARSAAHEHSLVYQFGQKLVEGSSLTKKVLFELSTMPDVMCARNVSSSMFLQRRGCVSCHWVANVHYCYYSRNQNNTNNENNENEENDNEENENENENEEEITTNNQNGHHQTKRQKGKRGMKWVVEKICLNVST